MIKYHLHGQHVFLTGKKSSSSESVKPRQLNVKKYLQFMSKEKKPCILAKMRFRFHR